DRARRGSGVDLVGSAARPRVRAAGTSARVAAVEGTARLRAAGVRSFSGLHSFVRNSGYYGCLPVETLRTPPWLDPERGETMEGHPIKSLMETAMRSIKDMVDVNTVVGDAVETQSGTVIVPVSRVSVGFVAGGGDYAAAERDRVKGEE